MPSEEQVVPGRGDAVQPREVLVRPRSDRRETAMILLAVAAVVGLMALRAVLLAQAAPDRTLREYQRLDDVLSGSAQTLYRTLLSSVAEILMLRDEVGLWPEAELLAMEAVPPFASPTLSAELRKYLWMGYDGGSWVDYLGRAPDDPGSASFILRLIDLHTGYHPHPHPGVDYDPEMLVAVQVWYFPEAGRPYPGERLPESGWLWLLRPDDPLLFEQPQSPKDADPVRALALFREPEAP